jgi:hypothetical protein
MNITLRVKQNLHIEGDSIISYETEVARIHPDGIEVFGKYSRTTSKHITFIRKMLDLPIKSKVTFKPPFRELEEGVNVRYDNSVCPESSKRILTHMRETQDWDSALVAGLIDDEVLAKDKYLIIEHLSKQGKDIQELRRAMEAMRSFKSKVI